MRDANWNAKRAQLTGRWILWCGRSLARRVLIWRAVGYRTAAEKTSNPRFSRKKPGDKRARVRLFCDASDGSDGSLRRFPSLSVFETESAMRKRTSKIAVLLLSGALVFQL